MGLFANKFSRHPDVLDQMAAKVAVCAMEQSRNCTNVGQRAESFVHVFWGDIRVDNTPSGDYGYGRKYSSYCMEFSDFGMEKVRGKEGKDFLNALLPYVKKHVEKQVKVYFPYCSAFVNLTTYEHPTKWVEDSYFFPAISIHVSSADKPEPPKPKYKPW